MTARRELLSTVACLTLTAGCSSASRLVQPQYSFSWMGVTNAHGRPHEVEVVIADGDDIVYEKQVAVERADGRDTGGVTFESIPSEPGRYTVRARIDGGNWHTAGPDSFDESRAYSVRLYVTPTRGNLGIFVGPFEDTSGTPNGSES